MPITTDEGFSKYITKIFKPPAVGNTITITATGTLWARGDLIFYLARNEASTTEYYKAFESSFAYASTKKILVCQFTDAEWVDAVNFNDTVKQDIIDGLGSTGSETNGFVNEIIPNILTSMVTRANNKNVFIGMPKEWDYSITALEKITFTAPTSAIKGGGSPVVGGPNIKINADTFSGIGTNRDITALSLGVYGNQQFVSSKTDWTVAEKDAIHNNLPHVNIRVPGKFSLECRFGDFVIINPGLTQIYLHSGDSVSAFDLFFSWNGSQTRYTITVRLGRGLAAVVGNPTTYFEDLGISTSDKVYIEVY